MIKQYNKPFYVLVTDNNKYLIKASCVDITDDLSRATIYNNLSSARGCLSLANKRFYDEISKGNYGYYGTEARKLGVNKISIAKITNVKYIKTIL